MIKFNNFIENKKNKKRQYHDLPPKALKIILSSINCTCIASDFDRKRAFFNIITDKWQFYKTKKIMPSCSICFATAFIKYESKYNWNSSRTSQVHSIFIVVGKGDLLLSTYKKKITADVDPLTIQTTRYDENGDYMLLFFYI